MRNFDVADLNGCENTLLIKFQLAELESVLYLTQALPMICRPTPPILQTTKEMSGLQRVYNTRCSSFSWCHELSLTIVKILRYLRSQVWIWEDSVVYSFEVALMLLYWEINIDAAMFQHRGTISTGDGQHIILHHIDKKNSKGGLGMVSSCVLTTSLTHTTMDWIKAVAYSIRMTSYYCVSNFMRSLV